MPTFKAEQLQTLTKAIFLKSGATEENAETVAQHLLKSNLAGHDSHGVILIPFYVKAIEEGSVDPKARGHLEVDEDATGLYDGARGFGQVVAAEAMKIAMAKARRHGVSSIGITNCGHIGRMADYCMIAMEEGMIGMTMVNSTPLMAPLGGLERLFNPSPLGVGIPAGVETPFVLDISMSVTAAGKIGVKRARGEKLPPGWIMDKQGKPSIDPEDFYAGGSLMPMGGSVAYKGYGLAFMVDILAGILTGNGSASSSERKEGNGVFMIAIDIAHFVPIDVFKKRMDEVIRRVKNSEKAPGTSEIMTPGGPELLEEERRSKNGVNVEENTWRQISDIAKRLDVKLPEPISG
jgi:LDH2 family malate/lactate/ureidoglycolate dehydrogenase